MQGRRQFLKLGGTWLFATPWIGAIAGNTKAACESAPLISSPETSINQLPLKLICVEEHVLDPAIGAATRSLVGAEAPYQEGRKYPALVGIHPAGGVKEQTIGLYASKMASHGFVVMVYDSSYQGESGGEPRLLEDPATRVEDSRCAVDYLTTLPYVDQGRIGVYGVCAGGGYALAAAQTERRFKAVAGISTTPMGEAARTFFGSEIPASELIKSLEAAANQLRRRMEARRFACPLSLRLRMQLPRTRRQCLLKPPASRVGVD